MNLVRLLERQARERPGQAALVDALGTCTFAQLRERVAKAAALLQSAGLQPDDPVLVLLPLSAELYVALLAIWHAGAVAMFVDPGAGRAQLERCCEISPPRALVTTGRGYLLGQSCPSLRRIPLRFVQGPWLPGARRWLQYRRGTAVAPVVSRTADAPALLTFTSGSTGRPKAAVRSHGLLLAQHGAVVSSLQLQPGGVDLATLPIFVLANLASGVASLLPAADLRRPGAIDPVPVLRQIREHRPLSVVASPAFLERIAEACRRQGTMLPSLRKVFTGGAPVLPSHLRAFGAMAPHARVTVLYGSTEAEPIAEMAAEGVTPEVLQRIAAGAGLPVGRPVPAVRLRVLPNRWGEPIAPLSREAFARAACAPGDPGEIVVTGPHVLKGYLGGRGDEETKFRVGAEVWHRTGDAGYLDPEGRLWLLGRAGARVEDSRGILYPFAVEGAASLLDCGRCALVAWRGCRVLLAEEGGSTDWVRVKERLQWAQLDEVRLLPRLPLDRRHNAKIDYPRLLETVRRGDGRQAA